MYLPILTFSVVVGALIVLGFKDRFEHRKHIEKDIEEEYGVAPVDRETEKQQRYASRA